MPPSAITQTFASILHLMNTIQEADQEADIERLYAEKKPEGVFSDLGKHQEKKDKYM